MAVVFVSIPNNILPQLKLLNQHKVEVISNTRANISGGGGYISSVSTSASGNVYGGGGRIDPITTTHEIVSYNVKITYSGPVNIGDRTIVTTIGNPATSAALIDAAKNQLGIYTLASTECTIMMGLSFLCCLCLFAACCYEGHRNDRLNRLNARIAQLAARQLEQDVGNLLLQADANFYSRITYQTQSSPLVQPTYPQQPAPQGYPQVPYPGAQPTYPGAQNPYPGAQPTNPAAQNPYPAAPPTYSAAPPTYSAAPPTNPAAPPTNPAAPPTNPAAAQSDVTAVATNSTL